MQRKRDGLVPIAEAFSDLSGPVAALRETPPPARRGLTFADQVNQLVGASEADPDRGFMARTMALCSLPRSNSGNRLQYKRVNGPFTLTVTGGNKLPFGNLPIDPGLALHRSGTNPKPRAGPGEIAGGLHASARCLQHQRRKVHPPPQPNEAAVWLQRLAGLWGCAARNDRHRSDCRPY